MNCASRQDFLSCKFIGKWLTTLNHAKNLPDKFVCNGYFYGSFEFQVGKF
jgi:hypothetical protein